ncbi:MAG: hypothetical protein WD670_06845, partial [Actinomycetota bacterium]
VTVRVWRTDGDLIFSTAQRDETAEVLALDDPPIQAAAAGEVVSVLSTEIEPRVGLHRVNEELFQTYVPVHLLSESFVDAVVEIDQRYGSIRGEALVLWRPLQFLFAGLFVGAVALAARSMRRGAATAAAPNGSQVVVSTRSGDRALRETQERLHAAERRAQEAEQRLKDGERGNIAAAAASQPGRGLEELDLKLRAAEAEREQHTGEIQRLRAALAEKEADLALAREGNGSTRAEAKKANRIIAEADRRAAEAEQKTTAAERRAMEATQRAVDASGRALEMEAQVRELEDKLAKVGTPAETPAPTKRRDGGERKAAAELKKKNDELTKTKAELQNAKAELQSASTQLVTARSELGTAEGDLGTSRSQIEQVQAQRDELRTKAADLEAALAEALAADGAKDGPVSELPEPQARLAEALAKLRELEKARSSLAAELEEAKASPAAHDGGSDASPDVESRIVELERARRTDVADLQRAQESFANTQVELANSTRKLREAEARIRELERDLGRPSRGVPTYVPNADEPRSSSRGEPNLQPATAAAGRHADVAAAETVDETIDLQSFEHRVSSLRAGLEASSDTGLEDQPRAPVEPPDPPEVAEPRSEPEPDERERELDPDAEGLSLRERLARAAAARHRGPLS